MLKGRIPWLAALVLIPLVLFSCLADRSVTANQGLLARSGTAGAGGFAFDIGPIGGARLRSDEAGLVVDNGQPFVFEANRIELELRSEADLPWALEQLKAKVVDQEAFPEKPVTIDSNTGRPTQGSQIVLKKLPYYSLEPVGLEADTLEGFQAIASSAGMKGHWRFDSENAARLYQRITKARLLTDSRIISVGVNAVGNGALVTKEGPFAQGGDLKKAPDTAGFWWVGNREFSNGANISQVGDESIWRYGTGTLGNGRAIGVAVIDSGFISSDEGGGNGLGWDSDVNGTHPVYTCWNTLTHDWRIGGFQAVGPTPAWHGRYVASLIFARHDNSIGSLGVAPGAEMYLIHTKYSYRTVKEAVDVATEWGCRVINMSMELQVPPQIRQSSPDGDALAASIKLAWSRRRILVASSGNAIGKQCWPAKLPWVMSVGAHDDKGKAYQYGDRQRVDIWAPGYAMAYAGEPNSHGVWRFGSGTSFAAPLVSGVLAVCLQRETISGTSFLSTVQSAITFLQSYGQKQYEAGIALDAINSARGAWGTPIGH